MKRVFVKLCSMLMAIITICTTLPLASMVSAWETVELVKSGITYRKQFSYTIVTDSKTETETNRGHKVNTSLNVMRLGGEVAYCVEPGNYTDDGVEYSGTSSHGKAFREALRAYSTTERSIEGDLILDAIAKVIVINDGLISATDNDKALRQGYGQLLIWELVCGYRDPVTLEYQYDRTTKPQKWYCSVFNLDSYDGNMNTTEGRLYGQAAINHGYYKGLVDAIRNFDKIPSFMMKNETIAKNNPITLKWNESKGKYEASLQDTNGVLGKMKFQNLQTCLGSDFIVSCNGNTLTISTKKAIQGTKVTGKVFKANAGNTTEDEGSYIVWASPYYDSQASGSSTVQKVMDADSYPDPVYGLFAVQTEEKPTITISGKKVWNDNSNTDGKRPTSITIQLHIRNADGSLGEVVDITTISEDEKTGEWGEYSFTVPKYDDAGNEISYGVSEVQVGNGYVSVVSPDGSIITNSRESDEIVIGVSFTWEDENDCDGLRPNSISFAVYGDKNKNKQPDTDETQMTRGLQVDDSYNVALFTQLASNYNGARLDYHIDLPDVSGYTRELKIEDLRDTGFNGIMMYVTYTHIPKPEFSVENLKVSTTEIAAGGWVQVDFDAVNWKKLSQSNVEVRVWWDDELLHSSQNAYAAAGVSWVVKESKPTYPETFDATEPDSGSDLHHTFRIPTIEADAGKSHTVKVQINWANHNKEVNPDNNQLVSEDIYVYSAYDLGIQAITPNAEYRAGTYVVTSFNVLNYATMEYDGQHIGRDVTPDMTLKVQIIATTEDGTVLADETVKKVVCPGATSETPEQQLVSVMWLVPEDIGEQAIIVKGIVNPDKAVGEIDMSNNTVVLNHKSCLYVISETPDPGFEIDKPDDWFTSHATSTNFESHNTAEWKQWVYKNGQFQLVQTSSMLMLKANLSADDNVETATYDEPTETWTIKSGYGINLNLYSMAYNPGDSGTVAQYAYTLHPEFNYVFEDGKFRTLDMNSLKIDSTMIRFYYFRENENAIADESGSARKHFVPMWFPDGEYVVEVVASDVWTPAGMMATSCLATINIKGSMYDDYYTARG